MDELEIREFYGEEALSYARLSCAAFHQTHPYLTQEDGGAAEWNRLEGKLRAMTAGGASYKRFGAFQGGRLAANVASYPFLVRFDGHDVPLSCIGAVCSEPELRRKGAVKALFQRVLRDMYENGQILSNLDPFTANYYRRFGYEATCEQVFWTIPTEYLPAYSNEGIVRYEGTEEQKRQIRELWMAWTDSLNLSERRGDTQWDSWFAQHAPFATENYGYIHSTDGVADGFLCYTTEYDETQPMVIDAQGGAFWYRNLAGLRGLLAYAAGLRDYARALRVCLPADADLTPLIEITGGWSKKRIERRAVLNGTSRVVDAMRALELCATRGSGRACIQLTDPYCPWNEGTYSVDYDRDGVQGVRRGGTPDIRMGAGAFGALLMGRGGLKLAEYYPDTEILGNRDGLSGIFYPKTVFSQTHFA